MITPTQLEAAGRQVAKLQEGGKEVYIVTLEYNGGPGTTSLHVEYSDERTYEHEILDHTISALGRFVGQPVFTEA